MINPIQKLREYYDIDCTRWWSITLELITKTIGLMLGLWYAFVFILLAYTMVSDVVTGEDSFSCDQHVEDCYDEYYY